jgi:hypothetical protein
MSELELLNVQKHYRIPPKLAELLLLLASHDVVTTQMIHDQVTPDSKASVHRLRQRVGEAGIEIHSLYATGYWLDPDARRAVIAAAQPDDLGES